MANDMVVFADISRTCFKVGLQHAEAILNLVAIGANIEDPGCIVVFPWIKIGCNGVVSIVFLFFLNN